MRFCLCQRDIKRIMKNIELQALLKLHPDDAEINIHVDAITSELYLDEARIENIVGENLILITMQASNP